MERKIRTLLLAALVLCALAPCASADTETLTLDLAAMTPDEVTTRPGGRNVTYDKIVIKNLIPRFHYNVDVAITEVGIPPLSLDAFGGPPPEERTVECDPALDYLVELLDAAETEKDVSDVLMDARSKADSTNCKDEVLELFVARTERTIDRTFSVKSSQTATVTVSRPGATFTLVLPGTARGEWRTSYGFFFVPDRDDRYFVDEEPSTTTGVASKFKIKKDAGREEFDFVPTVVFTFFPKGAAEKEGIGGLTAGLGYDLEKPFVFGGYSWAFNENIIFTGGVAFHSQSRLRGKYHAGDEVSAELEPQQLIEDTYGPNVYLGISFRFDEDIHARREALQAATAKANAATKAAIDRAKKAEEESKLRKAACIAQADADEAAAKVECKGEAVCVAKVETQTAAQKAKCAVTELDRVKAEQAEKEKKDALDARCERLQEDHATALSECTKKLAECKKAAKNAAAEDACVVLETSCTNAAKITLEKGTEVCLTR